jgi:hypothetical protein
MTKPLDPDIKALRAVNRALAALPDDAAVQRVVEWTVARAAGKSQITLPRLKWVMGASKPHSELVKTVREAILSAYDDPQLKTSYSNIALGALAELEEQLEAAQETGMEMVRALGNDAIHINARAVRAVEIWRDYLASNPASEPENVS